jgi:hypothetical protein
MNEKKPKKTKGEELLALNSNENISVRERLEDMFQLKVGLD